MSLPLLLALAQSAGGELPPASPASEPAPAAAPADPCSGPLFAAFDFWLGDWNVYARGDGALLGRSRVEKVNSGCAVRETWTPVAGPVGGSLNAPDLITARWHRYWLDKDGQRIELEGGPYQGSMILAGPLGKGTVLRITQTPLDRDALRLLAEVSTDDGLTWALLFEHLYLRAGSGD